MNKSSSQPIVRLLLHETYMAMIHGAVGSHMFRQLWATVDGKKTNIVRNGELSCAMFVSTILHHAQLIAEPHAMVSGTIADMKKSGWVRIARPKVGAVVRWGAVLYGDGERHEHIGFVVGGSKAISNSARSRTPREHHLTFGTKGSRTYRPVTEIWWHKKLDS